jgi:hypothetical protein
MLKHITVSEVRERITRVVGQEKAAMLVQATLDRIGRNILETPEDLLLFAECLETEEGLVRCIGRALKTQALVRGAVEPESPHSGPLVGHE